MKYLEQEGVSCVFIVVDGVLAGFLGLVDKLRLEAQSIISELQQQDITITILSGDRESVVRAVTANLGDIDRLAEVMPGSKANIVQQLQLQGEIVAMVGDGINDAPALMQADVGISLASGTDVSIDSADIVLLHNNLQHVVHVKQLAGKTSRTIKQNILLSIIYNIIMVPLAMMSLVSPIVAAFTMPISSLLVIGNAASKCAD